MHTDRVLSKTTRLNLKPILHFVSNMVLWISTLLLKLYVYFKNTWLLGLSQPIV